MENNKEIDNLKNEKIICSMCSKEMILRINKKTNHKFYGCSAYPICKNIKYILEKTGKNCPKCSSDLVFRENWETKKKFVACSGYPECKYTLDIDRYNECMEKSPNEPLPIFENKNKSKFASENSNDKSSKQNDKNNKQFKNKNSSKFQKQSFTGFNEKIVGVKRISKTTKGGRSMRFSALAIIGDKNGLVGYGIGKSIEVPVAIRKALKDAKNNIRKVKITKKGTLFHEITGRQGAGKVLLKPAPEGTGIIAGGPIRVVLELAGYTDIYSKNLGKNTSINMVMATLNGLNNQKTPKEIADLRDKTIEELWGGA